MAKMAIHIEVPSINYSLSHSLTHWSSGCVYKSPKD